MERTTSAGSPSFTIPPFSISIARLQYSVTQFMSWVTSTIALASRTSSPTRCLDFSRNDASPVESTSSSSRMSGSTEVAIANPSRARMPDE